jgi:hypothetical protein
VQAAEDPSADRVEQLRATSDSSRLGRAAVIRMLERFVRESSEDL